jgi:spermidine synthase
VLLERYIALILTFFTGLTALVYEVTWHAYLSNLIGSQARSAALIVATFLGGLSVGYHVFGRYSRGRSSRALVRACGLFEVLIGVWALAFTALYEAVFALHFGHSVLSGSLAGDALVAIALIAIPTAMMGASLPLLTQGLSRSLEDAAPLHAKIYVLNTLGAFMGAVSAGFYFLPTFGLSTTMRIMGVVNVIAGLLFILVARTVRATGELQQVTTTLDYADSKPANFWTYVTLAAAGGFVSITLQTALVRIVALSVGASVYAFSIVVSAFILVLALGAWGIAERRVVRLTLYENQLLLVVGIAALYMGLPYLPYSAHVFRTLLTNQPPTFPVYYGVVFVGLVLLLLIPVGSLGAALPLLFRESRDRQESLGTRVGALYGANTIGCVCGAIVGGYLSFLVLNLDGVWRGCMIVAALMLILLGRASKARLAVGAFALVLPLLLPAWHRHVFGRGLFRISSPTSGTYRGFTAFYKAFNANYTVRGYKDDPNSTICVTESKEGDLSILVNGKSDGNTLGGDRVTTKLMAHLPALLQDSTSGKAAVVGFGTGITVGSLAKYDDISSIDILEISSAVREFAPLFDPHNGAASKSEKVHWNMGDAYRFLMETPNKYAVIASEPSNPWVGGVERLYSREFYQLAREKLASGGIYAQWFHTYSVSEETLAMVLRTFKESFPVTHLFERGSDVILIGANEKLDARHLDLMRRRFTSSVIADDLKDIGIVLMNDLLLSEASVPWEGLSSSEIHTLDKPKLSYKAGRDFFLQNDSGVSELGERPYYKGWSARAFPNTLLGGLFAAAPVEDRAQAMALIFCGASEQTKDDWNKRSQRCKHALLGLMVRGDFSKAQEVPEELIAAYRSVVSGTSEAPSQVDSIATIATSLDWFTQFGAPFIELDPKRIRSYAEACYRTNDERASGCRSRVVIALASNGFFDEARHEFQLMLDDRMPFRSVESAELLARISGASFSPVERARVALISG